MIFRQMLIDDQVPVIFNEPIDLENGVSKVGNRITEIVSESGKKFSAKVFVDCSYEGDLMAEAGVTYTVGRACYVCCATASATTAAVFTAERIFPLRT